MKGPAIVLVRPQLAENVGMAARAMLNCGLDDLRLVAPRVEPTDERARRACSGADRVLEAARIFPDVGAAIADLHRVYATCPRDRDMVKPYFAPREAVRVAAQHVSGGLGAGFLFGPERTGLENDELTLADAIVPFPVNPEFSSLNLAQAVLVIGYEWISREASAPARTLRLGKAEPAPKGEVEGLLKRLEAALDDCGFLRNEAMRPTMVRNIRAFLLRAKPMAHEIRTAHGMLSGLTERPHGPERSGRPPRGNRVRAK
ncbi:MAG: RNA methyltransferase [Azospirillum sp.]|nr:RNA methyltransferase [Azospirillum sp.]